MKFSLDRLGRFFGTCALPAFAFIMLWFLIPCMALKMTARGQGQST